MELIDFCKVGNPVTSSVCKTSVQSLDYIFLRRRGASWIVDFFLSNPKFFFKIFSYLISFELTLLELFSDFI